MTDRPDRKIILENGMEFFGSSFGSKEEKVLEIVFNTSMTGYQEILSDPSYAGQAVVMTYPLIGNYGIAAGDFESERPAAGAMIVHECCGSPSHCRSVASLEEVMKRYGIAGVSGVDTRRLNRVIRDFGTLKALVADAGVPLDEGLRRLRAAGTKRDFVPSVSRRGQAVFPAPRERFRVAAIDCGMKKSIVGELNARGCGVTAVPWNTPAGEIEALNPDGILVSNGPGNPEDVPETVETVRRLAGRYPLFGICLGHQVLSLAYGARTFKLKFGHRGGNHPVRDTDTGRIEITSQNHSYAVDPESVAGTPLRINRVNLLDGTVEGVSCDRDGAFGVQYHPESAPGPGDSRYLFDRFVRLMEESGKNA